MINKNKLNDEFIVIIYANKMHTSFFIYDVDYLFKCRRRICISILYCSRPNWRQFQVWNIQGWTKDNFKFVTFKAELTTKRMELRLRNCNGKRFPVCRPVSFFNRRNRNFLNARTFNWGAGTKKELREDFVSCAVLQGCHFALKSRENLWCASWWNPLNMKLRKCKKL